MKLYISPPFSSPDRGEGGIRRVVEAQKKYLPQWGIEIVDAIEGCDVAAFHGGEWETPPPGSLAVAHTHGLYWQEHYSSLRWTEQVNRDVLRNIKQADAITAPSEWVAQAIRRATWIEPTVLYHGIEPDDWTVSDQQEGYVLWNKTRIDPICDPTPLTELARRRSDQVFVTTFANDASLPNVRIIGRQDYTAAKETVRKAGVYLATPRETFGIGTLEAMASGVPILGFNWGGQPEIVVHKEHGYLAKPYDYDDLAVGLDYVLKHHKYLALAGREHVLKEFTWQMWMREYAHLYLNLYNEAQRRPKVSVIITNYNLGKYLPEAVESARQACVGISHDITVVDDASTEPLPQLPDDVLVVKNKENRWLAESLNIGLALSHGKYIVSLDADNRLTEHFKLLVNALDQDRSLDIAYGKMLVFNDDGSGRFVSGWPPPQADLSAQVAHKNQITSTALYRRKVAERVGGYRPRCILGEDADFWARALATGATGRRVTDLVTLEYRLRDNSLSHTHKDWDWHRWYGWADGKFRLPVVGGKIYTHDNPKVSVIIPVGEGHERLVLDALDSVQAQSKTFDDWEVIIVNDSGKRLPWTHAWARVYRGGSKGVSHARNVGVAASRSDLVLFLDADDYLHPDALYHLYNTYHSSSDTGIFVYSDWFVAETGERRRSAPFDGPAVLDKLAFPVTCLYNKYDLAKHNIRWDESFTEGYEDWDFAIQAITAGLCGIRVPVPLLHYRLQSGTLRKQARSRMEALKFKVKDKYHDYYSGVKRIMPGCCGGGRYPAIMPNLGRTTVFDNVDLEKETSLVEYNPPPEWTGTRSFLGRVTGNRYRFGVDENSRVRRVYNVDVPQLVDLGYFKKVEGAAQSTTEPLFAAGPPAPASAPTTTPQPASTGTDPVGDEPTPLGNPATTTTTEPVQTPSTEAVPPPTSSPGQPPDSSPEPTPTAPKSS